MDAAELDDVEQSINNRLEQQRPNSANQLDKQMANQRAECDRKDLKSTNKGYLRDDDHLEPQTDLDTLEHDSRQDEQSDLGSEQDEQSETNDELDDDDDDDADKESELYDNDLDKDYGQLRRKNDYYLRRPITSTAKFVNSLPAIAAQQTKNAYNSSTNQIPVNTILPHYIQTNHLINSAANSDKLSNGADNHLSKKAKELRKNEYKREYQRLDNQPIYMMHSPSQNTSSNLNHPTHLTANEKSGCNL